MTASTTMMAYSMSKTITAAAVLQLEGLGRVSLDDDQLRREGVPQRAGPGIPELTLASRASADSGRPRKSSITRRDERSRPNR